MTPSSHRLPRFVALLASVAALTVCLVPAATADDWAGDRAASVAYQQLDPAIRTAIESRAPSVAAVDNVPVISAAPSDDFAWGAAALGVLLGVGATCVALACVTLVRHDGRLRSV